MDRQGNRLLASQFEIDNLGLKRVMTITEGVAFARQYRLDGDIADRQITAASMDDANCMDEPDPQAISRDNRRLFIATFGRITARRIELLCPDELAAELDSEIDNL